MSGISISNPPKGVPKRKYRQIHKLAVGIALKKHRRKNLRHHFETEAFIRYPKAYSSHHLAKRGLKSLINKRKNKNRVQAKFDAMHTRGNRKGILAFRKLLDGEHISELEEMAIVDGGDTMTSVRKRNSIESRRRRRSKKEKGQGKKPLVKSGLLRHMALNNPVKVTGPAHLVSISIKGTMNLNLNPTSFNKREALTAFTHHEEVQLVKETDKTIQKELNKIFK